MRLARVEISDYRSIFADERATPLILDLAQGMNALVGTNNCGKSNVLRAVALALDPNYSYDAAIDNPGPRPFAHPVITLEFVADGEGVADEEVLAAAEAYESRLGAGRTHAVDGRVVLRVGFEPTEEGVRRREVLMTPTGSYPATSESERLLAEALAKLRDSVRFVLISSGESIRSVLDGNFREILHSVVKERLTEAFASAEASRSGYLSGIQESLLGPLRDRLVEDLGVLFPEIDEATLVPEVPTIDRTLSNVTVGLKDLVTTPLSEKGTGVRGGVMVAMLSYLASNATRGMIFAVEEPEAFLHPAAQEDLRDHLEEIASRNGISLLVTTHSPYTVTRSNRGKVFGLAKDKEGRTRIASAINGDGEHSAIVSALFRESTFEDLLRKASKLPEDADAVLFVEGLGDEFCLRFACEVVGRPDLLEGLLIRPAGGAIKTVLQAVVARAAFDGKPVLVLLDNDPPGQEARKQLTGGTFGFKKGTEVLTYADIFPVNCQNFPIEAEDLFPESLWESFVEEHGRSIIKEMVKRPDDEYHYGFDAEAKEDLLNAHIRRRAEPKHVVRWIELILKLRDLAGFEVPQESAQEIVDSVARGTDTAPDMEGRALILTGKLDFARYQRSSVVVMDTATQVPPDVTHVGFYVDAEIKPEFPEVLQHYPSLLFSHDTVAQLQSTGKVRDDDVASLIRRSLEIEDELAGTARQVLLLTPLEDERTFQLNHPVRNTKEKLGRPLAWTIKPTFVSMSSLDEAPETTGELDALEGARS